MEPRTTEIGNAVTFVNHEKDHGEGKISTLSTLRYTQIQEKEKAFGSSDDMTGSMHFFLRSRLQTSIASRSSERKEVQYVVLVNLVPGTGTFLERIRNSEWTVPFS